LKKTTARVVADYSAIFLVIAVMMAVIILGGFAVYALSQYLATEFSEHMSFVTGRQLLGGAVAIVAITHGVRT
jgi:hypothetical protein